MGTDNKVVIFFHKIEDYLIFIGLFLLALLPAVEVILRKFFTTGIPSSSEYILHTVLWIAFVGGMITSRENRHLSLSLGLDKAKPPIHAIASTFVAFIGASITTALAWSSCSFILIGFDADKHIGFIPVKIVTAIMAVGYAVMALRCVITLKGGTIRRLIASSGFIVGTFFGFSSLANVAGLIDMNMAGALEGFLGFWFDAMSVIAIPAIILLIVSAFVGAPIFTVLGGIAYLLFAKAGGALEVVPNEAYVMLTSDTIPAIPLFTFAGFILSESKAGERLVRLFRALFGWLPGGLVIMSVMVCAFFTTFTGASGVTIVALGGLLFIILTDQKRYKENFATGILTASGSIGLLFPPSLPIILYGVVAGISIKDMFIGGVLPGVVMMLVLFLVGIVSAIRNKSERVPFRIREALSSIKGSIWEIFLPFIIILGYFLGILTIVETGAVTVLYAIIIEVFINKDLKLSDLPKVALKCVPIIGGVLVILAVSRGLSYYIIDAEVATRLTDWVAMNIQSKFLFLLLLNLALLVTGCLMDIFSAITVVVPLIVPLGTLFGIHPVHLGIIFLANLELGYITPPVGLNLFIASYRFNKPLSSIYRNSMPFFFILLAAVLLITYIPWISTAFLGNG